MLLCRLFDHFIIAGQCRKGGELSDFISAAFQSSSKHATGVFTLALRVLRYYSTCRTIKHPENFIPYSSREAAVNDGYVACKVCHP